MGKKDAKRKTIFDKYAANLSLYLKYIDRELILIKDGKLYKNTGKAYLCPLCYNVFFDTKINDSTNYLTLEHTVPKTVGGKAANVFTCKQCNNSFGGKSDNVIRKLLVTESFLLNTTCLKPDHGVMFTGHDTAQRDFLTAILNPNMAPETGHLSFNC